MRLLLSVLLAVSLAGCRQPPTDADASSGARTTPAEPVPETRRPAPAAPQQAVTALADARTRILLSPDGLVLANAAGSTRVLRFGEPAETVISAIAGIRGAAPERMRNDECGAGPLDMAAWPDGLTVTSQDGRFIGWSLNARRPASVTRAVTAAGIGVGSTRAELQAAHATTVHESTLGEEFDAGGLFGVLDGTSPGARIEVLWGGTSCNFR